MKPRALLPGYPSQRHNDVLGADNYSENADDECRRLAKVNNSPKSTRTRNSRDGVARTSLKVLCVHSGCYRAAALPTAAFDWGGDRGPAVFINSRGWRCLLTGGGQRLLRGGAVTVGAGRACGIPRTTSGTAPAGTAGDMAATRRGTLLA
jgi:hypothetical protein